jgi:type VI secretion system protein ImpA
MPPINVVALNTPVSAEMPSGLSFDHDPRWVEMQKAARSAPRETNANGVVVREAMPPDWRKVADFAGEFAALSRDLRLGMQLAPALLAQDGLAGLADALALISGWTSDLWDSVHPQLDPEDGNDPMMRVSALAGLSAYDPMLNLVSRAPLARSKSMGPVTWRDVARARGEPMGEAAPGEVVLDAGGVEAAFAEASAEEIAAVAAAALSCIVHVDKIQSVLQERAATACATVGFKLDPLSQLLRSISETLDQELAKRKPLMNGAAAGAAPSDAGAATDSAIRGRADVAASLDRICRYYKDYEPSSPIPLILQRTKRLVHLDFLGILKELAPDGVGQFGLVAGLRDGEDGNKA